MEPEVNVPLLRKMVEWVEYQEQLMEGREWLQAHWIVTDVSRLHGAYIDTKRERYCGTAMCVAGKIALDAGWKPYSREPGGATYSEVTKDGKTSEVETVASRLLWGTPYDPYDLFEGGNSAAQIREIAESIVGEPL